MTNVNPPSPFILEQVDSWLVSRPEEATMQPVQLVDLACGSGRHITAILGRGYKDTLRITAVDIDHQSLTRYSFLQITLQRSRRSALILNVKGWI